MGVREEIVSIACLQTGGGGIVSGGCRWDWLHVLFAPVRSAFGVVWYDPLAGDGFVFAELAPDPTLTDVNTMSLTSANGLVVVARRCFPHRKCFGRCVRKGRGPRNDHWGPRTVQYCGFRGGGGSCPVPDRCAEKLSEEALKEGIINAINELLEPVRQHFQTDSEAKALLETIKEWKKAGALEPVRSDVPDKVCPTGMGIHHHDWAASETLCQRVTQRRAASPPLRLFPSADCF